MTTKAEKSTVIASAKTADGIRIEVWSNGMVTRTRFGFYIEGIGRKKLPLDTLWLFKGEIELFDISEIPALFQAARKKNCPKLPGDFRRLASTLAS